MKKLLIFALSLDFNLHDTSEESSVWLLQNYEAYFDEVHYVLLCGKPSPPITRGNTTLSSLATGNMKLDVLLAPLRLLKIARRVRPTAYQTVEIVLAWWAGSLARVFAPAKIYLFPLVLPEVIYRVNGRSLTTFMPIWLERLVIKFNFWFVDHGLTSAGFGNAVEELKSMPIFGEKLIIADILPQAMPSPAFLRKIDEIKNRSFNEVRDRQREFRLIYIGRFNKEKMVDHLVRMLAELKSRLPVHLVLVGDGEEKQDLARLADKLGVTDQISFAGWVSNGNLPEHLANADVLVSPLTGVSLREAAIFGLPIVAYDMDWLKSLPGKEDAIMLVPEFDYQAMGDAVVRLQKDPELRLRLSRNAKTLASKLWLSPNLGLALKKVYES